MDLDDLPHGTCSSRLAVAARVPAAAPVLVLASAASVSPVSLAAFAAQAAVSRPLAPKQRALQAAAAASLAALAPQAPVPRPWAPKQRAFQAAKAPARRRAS